MKRDRELGLSSPSLMEQCDANQACKSVFVCAESKVLVFLFSKSD